MVIILLEKKLNLDVNLAISLREVVKTVFSFELITPLEEVGLTTNFVRNFSLQKPLK